MPLCRRPVKKALYGAQGRHRTSLPPGNSGVWQEPPGKLALREPLANLAIRPIAAVCTRLLIALPELGEAVVSEFSLLLDRILVQTRVVAAQNGGLDRTIGRAQRLE